MFLATSELISEIDTNNIIDIVSANNIQGASVDLRIGEKAKILKKQKDPIDLSKQPNFKELYEEVELSKGYVLKAGDFLYSETIEYIKIPSDKSALLLPRSSLARMGLILPSSLYANPGYEGHLPIVIHNLSNNDFVIPPYYKVMQMMLVELKGEAKQYHQQIDTKFFKESNITPPRVDTNIDTKELLEQLKKYE